MKITKGRLNNIIKEEVRNFVHEKRLLSEASGYVMDIYDSMVKRYGEKDLLEKMVEYFSDSELMDCFRYISKNAGSEEVPMDPQPALGGGASPEEIGSDPVSDSSSDPETRAAIPSKMNNKAVTDKDLNDKKRG